MKLPRLLSLSCIVASFACFCQPVHAGSWQLTYQCQGTGQRMGTFAPAYPYPSINTNYPWPANPTDYIQSDGSVQFWTDPLIRHESSANVSEAGSITATFTWVPSSAGDVPSGTALNVLEFAVAVGSDASSNGFGDPIVSSNGSPQSQGRHLISVPIVSSNGQFTATLPARTLSASSSATDTDYYGFPNHTYLDAYVDYNATQNSRAVTITSSMDPTYHKDPTTNQPVQNQPAPDGTINADIVQLGDVPGAAITYLANPVGSWAANSSYHWYSASTDHSGAGTFTSPSDPPYGLDVPYGNNVNFANQEHINLHCIDAGDGASATANYYVNWHNDFDGWITVVDTKDYGPLTRVTAVYHPLDDAKYSADFENTVKVDVKATGEGALGTDKIGAKFGAEIGAEYETSTKVTTEYTWVANKYNWIERQSFWHHREGTVDNYGFHGYMGLLHWTLDSAYNPGNPLVIDFLESQRAEDAGPAY